MSIRDELGNIKSNIFGLTPSQSVNLNSLGSLIDPVTGLISPLQEILYSLSGVVRNPIRWGEIAALGLTYADVSNANANYFDIGFRGKTILGGN